MPWNSDICPNEALLTRRSSTEYNICILHVLEAYQDMSVQLGMKDQAIEDLKTGHTKDIKDFEELASRWEMKEREYKAEVKKLEVLLSKTEGGLEIVSIARSDSVIHGSRRAAETISRDLDSIKERNATRNGSNKGFPLFITLTTSLISTRANRTCRAFNMVYGSTKKPEWVP